MGQQMRVKAGIKEVNVVQAGGFVYAQFCDEITSISELCRLLSLVGLG